MAFLMAFGSVFRSEADRVIAEHQVRTAVLTAAHGLPIGESFLARIINEASLLNDPGARQALAARLTQEYLAQSRTANIHGAGSDHPPGERLPLWRTSFASGYHPSGGAYSELDEGLGDNATSVTARNARYGREGIPADMHGYLGSLEQQGFDRRHVISAFRHARDFGLARDRGAIRNFALIEQHSIDANGMVAGLRDFRTRLQSDQELRDLAAQLNRTDLSEDQRNAIRQQIQARERAIESESTLNGRLDNPAETPRGREGGTGLRNQFIDEHRRQLGIGSQMGMTGALAAPEAQVGVPHVTSQVATGVHGTADLLAVTPAPITPGVTHQAADATLPNRPGQGHQVAQNTVQPAGPRLV